MLRRTLLLLGAALLAETAATPLAAQAPAAAGASGAYTTGQLDALLAPVALYPDALLTQTLMASTFPFR